MGVVTLRKNRRTEGFTESLQEIGYQGIRVGDLVVHTMDAFAGAVGVSDSNGKGTPVYSVCTTQAHANAHYYAAVIREMARAQWIAALATGIRERSTDFRYTTLTVQQLPLPPLDEQSTIVRYLDYVSDRIDRYIRAKQRLITLLEEQRQAVIHQVVTRGLDPNVPLMPSGIPWLGKIPAHWEVRRLKTLCSMKSGDAITAEIIKSAEAYPVYGGNGIRGFTSDYTHDGEFALIGRQGALCGNVHIARGRFWASEHAVVVLPSTEHILGWLAPVLSAMNLNQYSIAAAQPGLAVERILNLSIPVPPRHEQVGIADYLNRATADTGLAISRINQQIQLMREYRDRLIADIATGQLDVREPATGLPSDLVELSPC